MLFSKIENWEYAWMFSSVGALIRTIWWLSRDPWVVRHRQPESASLPPIQKLPYANAPTNILIEGFFLFPCSIDNWLLYFSMVGFGSIYSSVSNHPHSSLLQQSPQMTVAVEKLLDADHWHSLTLFECEHLKVVWIRRGSTFVLGLIDCYKVVSFVNPPSPLEQLWSSSNCSHDDVMASWLLWHQFLSNPSPGLCLQQCNSPLAT